MSEELPDGWEPARITSGELHPLPSVNLPTNDKVVFAFCELWALVLGFPPGDDLYHGAPVTGRMVGFACAASVFQIVGPSWPWLKGRINRRWSVSLVRAATDFRWWLIGISVGVFISLLWPFVISPLSSSYTTVKNSPAPNIGTKTQWLKLDDAEKWKFSYALHYTPLAENGERLTCPFVANISSDDQWRPEKSAVGVWGELQPMLELASWHLTGAQAEGHPHYSPGLTILIGTESGNMLRCAASLARLLQDTKILSVSVRTSQATLSLAACKNECLELDFGAIEAR